MYNSDLPTRAELPSTGKLLRSTVVAALVALVLLVTTILPAEYGIDPTGIGRALDLTRMGEIKVALATEARSEQKPLTDSAPVAVEPAARPAEVAATAVVETHKQKAKQQHSLTITLAPGQGAEVKLAMKKDAIAHYEWTTVGGTVNFDTHGDPDNAPKGFYHGYGKGRNETGAAGKLQAAFDGKHGWFWRNRSDAEVTVALKTSGEYEQIKRVL